MTECWASSIAKNVEVSNFGRLRNALTHEIIEPTFTYRGHAVAYPCYKKMACTQACSNCIYSKPEQFTRSQS